MASLISKHLIVGKDELELHELLGSGSFGSVHKGIWNGRGGGLSVAIKQVSIQGEETMQDLCKELNIMASLRYNHICAVHGGCIISSTELWIVLDYIEGGSLFHYLHTLSEPIQYSQQLNLSIQAAQAVNYLHCCSTPLLHRDIKSHNFLVKVRRSSSSSSSSSSSFSSFSSSPSSSSSSFPCLENESIELILTDFGISKSTETISIRTSTTGTLNWAAPEILREDPLWSEKADIFSLGMVFYELVAREIPYKADTNLFALHKKIVSHILPEIPSHCNQDFANVIKLCWNKEPSLRPTSLQLLQHLRQLQANVPSTIPTIIIVESPPPSQPVTLPLPQPSSAPALRDPFKSLKGSPLLRSPSAPTIQNEVQPQPPSRKRGPSSTISVTVTTSSTLGSSSELLPPNLQKDKRSPRESGGNSSSEPSQDIKTSRKLFRFRSGSIDLTFSPLFVASAKGDVDTVRTFVASGANLGMIDDAGRTPLHIAAEFNRATCITILVQGGADLQTTNNFGETPLHIAAEKGNTETVRILVLLGAKVDEKGDTTTTALHLASEAGHTETAKELLKLGAAVDHVDDLGRTSLHWAAEEGHTEIVKELVKSGANVKAVADQRNTPLHLAAKRGHSETIKELVKLGANVNATCSYSGTALHMAAEKGHTESVKALLRLGAKVDMVNNVGKTPAQLAAVRGHGDICHELLAKAIENKTSGKGECILQ